MRLFDTSAQCRLVRGGTALLVWIWLFQAPGVAQDRQAPDLGGLTKLLEEANREHAEALKPNARDSASHVRRALDQYGLIVEALEFSTSLVPEARRLLLEALFQRGRVYVASLQPELAKEEFARLLRIEPGFSHTDPSRQVGRLFEDAREATVAGLRIESVDPEDCEVRLNGRVEARIGIYFAVTAGPLVLEASRPGHERFRQEFEIAPGSQTSLPIRLHRNAAVFTVVTVPAGVQIEVDGKAVGTTAPGPPPPAWELIGAQKGVRFADMSMPFIIEEPATDVTRTMVFSRPCFRSGRFDWKVTHLEDSAPAVIRMVRQVGSLSVPGPAGATVRIDGVERGRAPLQVNDLCAGRYRVQLETPQGRHDEAVEIRVDSTTTLAPRLRPTFAIVDANLARDTGPDPREAVVDRLQPQGLALVSPPLSESEDILKAEGLVPGWLHFDPYRNPIGEHAQPNPVALRAFSERLAERAGAQGVAELHVHQEDDGTQRQFRLTLLARGSGVPDVIEFHLDRPDTVARAVAALDASPSLSRVSAGFSVFEVHGVDGVVVSRVVPGSSAAAAGIAPGQVITTLNGKKVADAAGFESALAGVSDGDGLTLTAREGLSNERRVDVRALTIRRLVDPADRETWLPNVLIVNLRGRLAARTKEVNTTRLNLAVALMMVAEYQTALAELDQVTLPSGAGVSLGTVEYLKGLCLHRLAKYEEARGAFERAAEETTSLLTEDGQPIPELAAGALTTLLGPGRLP